MKNNLLKISFSLIFLCVANWLNVFAQTESTSRVEPLGIALENYDYPFPVRFMEFKVQNRDVRLAYMDVKPADEHNGQTVVLMHGKNFFGAYWEDTIRALVSEGFRVVIPDQIGFGKSSKPIIHYSFHQMGMHTKKLLDKLEIESVAVGGHSMGGMAAARFTIMFPGRVTHLFLENPIGLEDYRLKTPWVPVHDIYKNVLNVTEDAIREQHKAYYTEWDDRYENYVQVHYRWTHSGDYPRFAKVSAITSQMVYEQPVIHEFPNLQAPTLLIIGQEDRTAPGRNRAKPKTAETMGYYPDLGKRAHEMIPNSILVELHNVGHTPHFEAFDQFFEALFEFLSE